MTLVTTHALSHSFGSRTLFSNIALSLDTAGRYALVGSNGCGKSTLAKILAGLTEPTSGRLRLSPGARISYVPQEPHFAADVGVLDAALAAWSPLEEKLRTAEEGLSTAGSDGRSLEDAMVEYQHARDAWDAAEGDEAEVRAEASLRALGLDGDLKRPAASLSGGERGLVALAAALAEEPDLLILDEPGNHLDFQSLAWLEAFLGHYNGALLMISHNRYLMDRLCTEVLEMADGTVTPYPGNYSDYRLTMLRNRAAAQADRKAQLKDIRRLEDLVAKFQDIARRTGDPAWGKRLRARRTQLNLAKDQLVEVAVESKAPEVSLVEAENRATVAIRITGYSKAFGTRVLFRDASLEIHGGERVALLGPNGSGKSTLLKDLVKVGGWHHDVLKIGPSFTLGYMAQNPAFPRPEESLLDHVRDWGALSRDGAFAQLSPMAFSWDDLGKPLSALSGGEVARLQLAHLRYRAADLLILDEPTNHLDAQSREVVEEALTDFQGTLFVVSHDRYFLDKTVDRVVEISDGTFVSSHGGFSDWWSRRNPTGRLQSSGRRVSRGSEQRRNPSSREWTGLEDRIEAAEKDQRRFEKELAAAVAREDYRRSRELAKALDKVSRRLEDLWRRLDDG